MTIRRAGRAFANDLRPARRQRRAGCARQAPRHRAGARGMLSEGHVLLEDVPGHRQDHARPGASRRPSQGTSTRIQFTPDLLPGDMTGVTHLRPEDAATSSSTAGRCSPTSCSPTRSTAPSPKTQSALLEVMEEGQVTVDGVTHEVGRPFMVIATQNPIEQAGTYRLPEAQLDRFLMRTSIGYPDHASTVRILEGAAIAPRGRAARRSSRPTRWSTWRDWRARGARRPARATTTSSRLVEATRTATEVRLGVSVRGALALIRAPRRWAAAHGRNYVIPDDIKSLAEPVLAHRLVLDPEAEFDGVDASRRSSGSCCSSRPPRATRPCDDHSAPAPAPRSRAPQSAVRDGSRPRRPARTRVTRRGARDAGVLAAASRAWRTASSATRRLDRPGRHPAGWVVLA